MESRIEPELYTVSEAAMELRVSSATIKRWLRAGDLAGVRLPSGVWRVPVDGLQALQTHRRLVPAPGHHKRLADRSAV